MRVMFQQDPQHQERPLGTPYTISTLSTSSFPWTEHQPPTAPAPALLHRPLKAPLAIWLSPIQRPSSPESHSGSSTPTLSLSESRPKSLGNNGYVTAIRRVSDLSYQSEKNIIVDHHRHFRDSFNPPEAWDPEKASMRYGKTQFKDPKLRRASYTGASDDMFGDSSRVEDHAVWILIYLSLFCPILTIPIAIYTLLATPFLLTISLLSCLTTHGSLSTYIFTFLAPPVNFQFGLILSRSQLSDADRSNQSMLILLNLFSPVYAVAVALSAWVAAMFWFYAAILGDPDGRDGKDDGRAAVLGVRGWWERWLQRGMKDDDI